MTRKIEPPRAIHTNLPAALALVLAICATLFMGSTGRSADFGLNGFSIDGGGGVSSGGTFLLAGTVGQPAVGTVAGGSFTLRGGFWRGADASVPDAPRLSIARNAGSMVVSWPAPSTGFVLQETDDLGSRAWTNVATTPAEVGGQMQVQVNPPAGTRFYRLRK